MADKTMKALVLRKHGGLGDLEVVADYPVPQATEGNVVIRVRASSFNYHDVFTVKGMPGIKVPLPVIPGLDMAGEISETGPGVTKWKAGDRVLVNPLNKKKGLMGEMLDGGMAEYCLVAADQLVAVPGGVSFEAYSRNIQSSVKAGANLNNATPDWSYTFMAGAGDGGFKMAYNVNGYGATFGLWGWSIAVTGGPEGVQQLLVSNAFDPTTAGVFNASLTAGSQYTATLSNNANVSCDGGCTFIGGMNGNFRWEVTPVPEPQTYALMALGLGLMGWVARRRRRAER